MTCTLAPPPCRSTWPEKLRRLPPAAAQMLESGDWQGGRLARVESETVRPSVADLKWNARWLYAVCARSPSKAWLQVIRGGHKCAGRVAGFLNALRRPCAGALYIEPESSRLNTTISLESDDVLKNTFGVKMQ